MMGVLVLHFSCSGNLVLELYASRAVDFWESKILSIKILLDLTGGLMDIFQGWSAQV